MMWLLFTVRTEKDHSAVEVEVIHVVPDSTPENTDSQNSSPDDELVFEEAEAGEVAVEVEELENIENPSVTVDTQITAEINQGSDVELETLESQSAANEKIESAIKGLTLQQPGHLHGPLKTNNTSGSGETTDAGQAGPQFNTRTSGIRKNLLRAGGGNAASEQAVANALNWLAEHQNRDGSWSFNHSPGDNCSNFLNPGSYRTKMGATGLALFPFLGAGHTHQKKINISKDGRGRIALSGRKPTKRRSACRRTALNDVQSWNRSMCNRRSVWHDPVISGSPNLHKMRSALF